VIVAFVKALVALLGRLRYVLQLRLVVAGDLFSL